MSEALYNGIGGLRFWNEAEIEHRELAVKVISTNVKNALSGINPAWSFYRIEGPTLTPNALMSSAYGHDDVWHTDGVIGNMGLSLRAETTASSYEYARHLLRQGRKVFQPPLCVWQAGKSYRREKNDGANARNLRFYEFWQLEFQCIYNVDTKADYRGAIMPALKEQIGWLTKSDIVRVVKSDRLPAYSVMTADIEVLHNDKYVEIASISSRVDFEENIRVLEIAVGLDRIVEVFMHRNEEM